MNSCTGLSHFWWFIIPNSQVVIAENPQGFDVAGDRNRFGFNAKERRGPQTSILIMLCRLEILGNTTVRIIVTHFNMISGNS